MLVESSWARQLDDGAIGDDLFALAADIYPICRSITGNGVRETLKSLGHHIEIGVREVPTGAHVFDWTIHASGTFAMRTLKMHAAKRSSTLPSQTYMS